MANNNKKNSVLKGKTRKTVAFIAKKIKKGTETKVQNLYIQVFEHIFTVAKMEETTPLETGKSKSGEDYVYILRGSKGAKSIKFVFVENNKKKFMQIPVPAQATLLDCYKFIATQTELNKDSTFKGFVSPNGRFYPKSDSLDTGSEIDKAASGASRDGKKDSDLVMSPDKD